MRISCPQLVFNSWVQDVRMHSLLHEALQVRLKSAELVTDSHMDPHTDSHNSLRTGPHTAPHTISLSQSQANIFQPIANSSTSPTLKFLQEADQLNAEQSITGNIFWWTGNPPLTVLKKLMSTKKNYSSSGFLRKVQYHYLSQA